MSFLDSLIVQLRDAVNGAEPVDMDSFFYNYRPAGPDFKAPWSIANINQCQGNVIEIEGESPIEHWLIIVDRIENGTNEYWKDRTEFLTYDFGQFNVLGEILADQTYQEKGQSLRRYRYVKKQC
mmetsp:Transcript_31565/g.39271  ORF Transcript_31565/g.39271 Transcript_31565/m.39271 type:complete len:124 (-) Transcript_31565:290-661(-)